MSPLLPPASNDSNSSGQLSDWSCSSSQSGSSSSSGFGSSYESTESNGPKERRIIAIGSNQCRNQKKSAQYTLKLPLEKHKENAQRLDRHELRATVSNERFHFFAKIRNYDFFNNHFDNEHNFHLKNTVK